MRRIAHFTAGIFLLLLAGCADDPLKVDVSDVPVGDVQILKLEDDLFNIDTANLKKATADLSGKYGSFYSAFVRGIINNGGIQDSTYEQRILQFISDADMKQAYADCKKVHGDGAALQEEITNLYKHFRYYFPEKSLPKTVTMMSGFNYPVVVIDTTLAIGLEMYLGSKNAFYKMLAFPNYKTMFMNKENIVPDVARIWMLSEFPYNMDKNDFLSQIIYMGKIMYLTDALLPDVHDTLKIQYTGDQMDYCIQNEHNVWSYFASQKLLYTTDQAEIMKFTSDGPFTAALSKESAPRIGYWTGWQIVRQFMKNNPEITIPQLIQLQDAQQILIKAKYKPAR